MTEFVPKDFQPTKSVIVEPSNVVSLAGRRTKQMFESRVEPIKVRPKAGQTKTQMDNGMLAKDYVEECERRQVEMANAKTISQLVKAMACVPDPPHAIAYSPKVKVTRRQCGFVVEACAEKLLAEAVKQAKESFSASVDTLPPARAIVARIAPYAPAAARKASIQLDAWESARNFDPA